MYKIISSHLLVKCATINKSQRHMTRMIKPKNLSIFEIPFVKDMFK